MRFKPSLAVGDAPFSNLGKIQQRVIAANLQSMHIQTHMNHSTSTPARTPSTTFVLYSTVFVFIVR